MRSRLTVVCISLIATVLAWAVASLGQISIIPGSSSRGAELFKTKGCVDCHSFAGAGGKIAPDLAQQSERLRTPMQLASALWNHAPRMWRSQQARQVQPVLDSMETADLFAYFYSLSYSRAPGNAARGAQTFEEKGCRSCHEMTVGATERGLKIPSHLRLPISNWSGVNDPLAWAERMWNHSAKVYEELSNAGVTWPRFSTQEMVDLLAYLRSLPEARSQSATFPPGDPEQGHVLFERACESCHSFGGRTAQPKIDLQARPAPDVLVGYAATMWNHAPLMHSRTAVPFPVLGGGDLSNLLAYLFFQRYVDETGNVERGARLFEAKNCIVCHENRRKETGAPDLTLGTERYSPITISAAIWQHGPSMLRAGQKQQLSWPELKPSELADLMAFLNSRLVSRIARPN
jgi:cytochrome c2